MTGAYDRNSKVSGTQGASTHDFSSLITSESVSIEPFRFSIVDKEVTANLLIFTNLKLVQGMTITCQIGMRLWVEPIFIK